MNYKRLEIPDLVLCEPKIHEDNRGFVFEAFKKDSFNNFLGFEVDFCQDNISYSKYGVIRGLHTNTLDFAQSKLVSVLQGKILDVAVDFRVGSPSFGKVILFHRLEKLTARGVLLQVIENQSLELIIKRHLQRAIPPGFKFVI